MKTTLLSFFFLTFLLNKTHACCGSYNVYSFPAGKNIGSNSIFVIGFSEDDFKYKGRLNKFAFTACNKQGEEYPLEVVETLFSGTNGQVVLRSKKDFTLNDSLSLKVVLLDTVGMDTTAAKSFIAQVGFRKWKVARGSDTVKPNLLPTKVRPQVIDNRNSSASGMGIKITLPATDNSFKELAETYYSQKLYPILYEVTYGNEKFLFESFDHTFQLYNGICGGVFDFQPNVPYVVSVRVGDGAGNWGEAVKRGFVISL